MTRKQTDQQIVVTGFLGARLGLGAMLCLGLALTLSPQPVIGAERVGHQEGPYRIFVKLKPALARAFETELPENSDEIALDRAADSQVKGFQARHKPLTVAALYGHMIRTRKLTGKSDEKIAEQIRQRFAGRAARRANDRPTPEISRTYVLEFEATQSVDEILTQLRADANVDYAEPVGIASASLIPNDPYLASSGSWGQPYGDLWGMTAIKAQSAWDTTRGEGVVVAVVDTGIDATHPDIAANVWTNADEIAGNGIDDDTNGLVDDVRGWNFIAGNNAPDDGHGHGTHVSGTIAAVGNNGTGVVGVAYNAKIMPLKGLDDAGSGAFDVLASAINYAANNGADVINASFRGYGTDQTLNDAIAYAASVGTVFVAAAGNDAMDAANFTPANSPDAITVAASSNTGELASFSNFGAKIDVTAPGVDILSLRAAGTYLGFVLNDTYTRLDGTSMAAPHVAGLSALIIAKNPTFTTEDVRQVLHASSVDAGSPGWDPQFGYGIADAAKALTFSSVLRAHISSPIPGTVLSGSTAVTGTVSGNTLSSWVLEYGVGQNPTSWVQLNSRSTPVTNGMLGTFDPALISEGTYTLRLRAIDTTGHVFTDYRQVNVDYVSITSPLPADFPSAASSFKPGASCRIEGTAADGGHFSDFGVSWAPGINPTGGWSTTGMVRSGGGSSPVTDGLLATWTTPAVTTAGYYTIRLTLNGAMTRTVDSLVYLEPSLLTSNWPQAFVQPTRGVDQSSLGALPVQGPDGSISLFVEFMPAWTPPGAWKRFSAEGVLLNTIQRQVSSDSYSIAAVGEVDVALGQELVTSNDPHDLTIFRSDPNTTQRVLFPPAGTVTFVGQIVLEDLDGDGQQEILAYDNDAYDPLPGTRALYALKSDGSPLNGNFPINLQTAALKFLVGDIDGDGQKEIVVAQRQGPANDSPYSLSLFAKSGVSLPWNAPSVVGDVVDMALADLDHNGKLATIVSNFDPGTNTFSLHVFKEDGTERVGWPKVFSSQSAGWGVYVSVGDLDLDGSEEIIVSDRALLHVFKADGTYFSAAWPLDLTSEDKLTHGNVVLADINGDRLPEILFCKRGMWDSPATLVAVSNNKVLVRSWQLHGNGRYPIDGVGTVGDFNRDGLTDIAMLSSEVSTTGGALAWIDSSILTVLTSGTTFNANANPWPMRFHDPRHTSVRRAPIVAKVSGNTATATLGDLNGVTKVEFYVDGVLKGTDTTAPYSLSLASIPPGAHILVAKAYDASGVVGVSTTSFTLATGGGSVTGVVFSSDKTTITWAGSCNPASYDVVRGVISDLPNFSLATCMENNSIDAASLALHTPPAGSGYYYLASCNTPKDWNDGTQTGTRTITPCP